MTRRSPAVLASLPKRVRRRLRREAKRAVKGLADARQRRHPVVTAGVIEKFTSKEIVGWIEVAKGAPTIPVRLCIGAFEANSVAAVVTDNRTTDAEIRTFRFALNDFWKFVGKTDRVIVRAGDCQLPFSGRGMFYQPLRNGAGGLAELKIKLRLGHVFASNGRLILSKNRDRAWQASVMGLYNRVRTAVHEIAGYDAFLIYGSLLGAVRENGFIGHDFDFDAAYISKHRDGPAAARELAQIARALIDYGFNVESRVITLHIYDPASSGVKIDLFHLFFDAGGVLRFPWGVAGTTDFMLAQWSGTREIKFGGSTGLVPHGAEALVETMYGASWRVPNSGFSWVRERRSRATEGRVPAKLGAAVNWENFYATTTFDAPSPFFQWVVTTPNLPGIVVDLGCGDGRDTFALARSSGTALGLDLSEIGLRTAQQRSSTVPEQDRPSFVRCDFDDRDALRSALESLDRGPGSDAVLWYGRFLLHALPPDTQEILLEEINRCAQDGDLIALEFRTLADDGLPKAHSLPTRYYVDPAQLLATLTDTYGFSVLSSEEGTGLSPFGNEDPQLFRVIARRST
ncbi:MAG: hypothetical protein QOE25_910 [Actinomycetota bacterium]|nr:hypothetical protein [Actinomycetota bacterium]